MLLSQQTEEMAAAVHVRAEDCFSPLVDRKCLEAQGFAESKEYKDSWTATHITLFSKTELSHSNWPKLALNQPHLKQHVRCAVEPSVRKDMWLGVTGVVESDSVLFAKAFGEPVDDEEIGDQTFGTPFDLEDIPLYLIKPSFGPAFERVLSAVYFSRHGSINLCPLVPVLTKIMLHFIDEWEVFALLSHLMSRTAWLDQGHSQLSASVNTLISIIHSHIKPTLVVLDRLKPASMSQESFLRQLTKHWYIWPFYKQPFWITVRVVDMYLVEGPKVLYRLALSALKQYANLAQSSAGSDIETCVQELLSSLSVKQRTQWFHDAFSIPRLPWTPMLTRWVRSQGETTTDGPMDSFSPPPIYNRHVTSDLSSQILTSDELWSTVWAWLPDWVTGENPVCVFRASRDGYNLHTLYRKCEDLPNILLLIRTTKNQVFGSFIATELRERHGAQFFGTGETFLFSLTPDPVAYRWTGETDLILRGNDQEFLVGSGGGTFGLWIDSELDKGETRTCQAFKNSPLTGTGEHQFSCAAVEVYDCS